MDRFPDAVPLCILTASRRAKVRFAAEEGTTEVAGAGAAANCDCECDRDKPATVEPVAGVWGR